MHQVSKHKGLKPCTSYSTYHQCPHAPTTGITEEKLDAWYDTLIVRVEFVWPSETDGEHMFSWEEDDNDDKQFEGMHGDEMYDEGDELADEDDEEARHVPFDLDLTDDAGAYEVATCPAKLPHDMTKGMRVAQWFGEPYNEWYIGTVLMVNKAKTVTDNVTAEFQDETYGTTWGHFVAHADTYWCDRNWVLLTPRSTDSDTEEHFSESECSNSQKTPTPTVRASSSHQAGPSSQPEQSQGSGVSFASSEHV